MPSPEAAADAASAPPGGTFLYTAPSGPDDGPANGRPGEGRARRLSSTSDDRSPDSGAAADAPPGGPAPPGADGTKRRKRRKKRKDAEGRPLRRRSSGSDHRTDDGPGAGRPSEGRAQRRWSAPDDGPGGGRPSEGRTQRRCSAPAPTQLRVAEDQERIRKKIMAARAEAPTQRFGVAEDQERIRRKIRGADPPERTTAVDARADQERIRRKDAPGATSSELLREQSKAIQGKIAAEKIHMERLRERQSRRRSSRDQAKERKRGDHQAVGKNKHSEVGGGSVSCSSSGSSSDGDDKGQTTKNNKMSNNNSNSNSNEKTIREKIMRTTQGILRQQRNTASGEDGMDVNERNLDDLMGASSRWLQESMRSFRDKGSPASDDGSRRKIKRACIASVALVLIAGVVSGVVVALLPREEGVRCGTRARRFLRRVGARRGGPLRRLRLADESPARAEGSLSDGADPKAPTQEGSNVSTDDLPDSAAAAAAWLLGGEPASAPRPTSYPTMASELRKIKGLAWYDRDADGRRSAGIRGDGIGDDVEFSHVVGGVRMVLVPCDKDTRRSEVSAEEMDRFFSIETKGYDVPGRSHVIPRKGNNGQFDFYLEEIDRYYYIQATAPEGYLLTSGVCNDDEFGWECEYPKTRSDAHAKGNDEGPLPDIPIGIRTGRSSECTYAGYQQGSVQKPLFFGVMRKSDNEVLETSAALVLKFEGDDHLLDEEDAEAIGTVTAEALALGLDLSLAKEFDRLQLNLVYPKEVFLLKDGGADVAGNGMAVIIFIRAIIPSSNATDGGRNLREFNLGYVADNFDYIVEDSINRDAPRIQRSLEDYNRNCREQTSRVEDEGLGEEDFGAVASTSGVARPGVDRLEGDVFSTACADELVLPEYFESSLAEIDVKSVEEVDDLKCETE